MQPLINVVNTLQNMQDIDVIAVNPKLPKDEKTGNEAYFGTKELVQFLNYYTDVLNKIFSPDTIDADKMDRYYLVPAFISADEERHFLTLTAKDGKDYIPMFDNLDSFEKWYDSEYFGNPFKENHGQVLVLKIVELLHPDDEKIKHDFGKAEGVTLNPFDFSEEDYAQSILSFDDLKA